MSIENGTEFDQVAKSIIKKLEHAPSYRIIVLIVGRPGSGKTTIANYITERLNEEFTKKGKVIDSSDEIELDQLILKNGELNEQNWLTVPSYDACQVRKDIESDINDDNFQPRIYHDKSNLLITGRGSPSTDIMVSSNSKVNNSPFAIRISMDGFHLPRSVLRKMNDPNEMMKRRGSPPTFDSGLVAKLVSILQATCDSMKLSKKGESLNKTTGALWMTTGNIGIPSVSAPDFDHEKRDPTPNGSIILPQTRVLIIEGLYLLLERGLWNQICQLASSNASTIYCCQVESNDKIIIRERTARRHVDAGICRTIEEGRIKYDSNDSINGDLVDSYTAGQCIDKVIRN